ncbi:hypothetical protein EJ419_05560 [Alloscardovia theropitheci]|uniref:Uncharacterized protein n=1 Tax=Alloscardovia theropitheci TaxID=2496842 RepID=A0A4R0QRW2_9BIFI|nr:hypothetical protein [Alloscardovia theropitheci]TCD54118.1 hypothetical protein EJ419_05560 [Alloscardovia theropitheci]
MVLLDPFHSPLLDTDPEYRSVLYAPFDWYNPDNAEYVETRIWVVVRFTDWLCMVNPQLDENLPSCWTSHAWLILTMDALYMKYIQTQEPDHDMRAPYEWITAVQSTIDQIRSWANTTNHHGANPCPNPDDTYSAHRIHRRTTEESNGYKTDHNYIFPTNPLTTQTLIDHLTTSLTLENIDENTVH